MAQLDAAVSPQELEEATAKQHKALELRDAGAFEEAVQLLGEVLRVRNRAHGDNALECAETYLYYGQALFEQAQASSDLFGDQVRSAADQRAKALAAAEREAAREGGATAAEDGGSSSSSDEEDEGEESDSEAAADEEEQEQQEAGGSAPPPEQAAAAPADAAAAASAGQQEGQAGSSKQAGEAAAGAARREQGGDAAMAEATAPEGEQAEEAEAAAGDEAEGAGGDGGGDGDGGAEADGDGDGDDMALAWDMLELARLTYQGHGGAAAHADKLADCHVTIGDILAEQEKFDEAVAEYNTAQQLIATLDGGLAAHKRRAAELEFKRATALQLNDCPAEALEAMQAARAHLSAAVAELEQGLAAAGAPAAAAPAAAAFAAFAAVLASYTPPPAPAAPAGAGDGAQPAGVGDEAAAKVAKQQRQLADLRSVLEGVDDRIAELKAAVDAHVSMREQLRSTFALVAAGGGSGDDGGGEAGSSAAAAAAAAAAGVHSVTGFGAPRSQAGAVQDIGVIGRGRRVAPTPAAPPAAAGEPGIKGGASHKEASKEQEQLAPAGTRKRSLSDLTSSDQEQPGGGEAGVGDGRDAAAKAAAAAAKAVAAGQAAEAGGDDAAKRARV